MLRMRMREENKNKILVLVLNSKRRPVNLVEEKREDALLDLFCLKTKQEKSLASSYHGRHVSDK